MIGERFSMDKLFGQVQAINNIIDTQLLEVSVKRHQITLILSNNVISFKTLDSLLSLCQDNITDESFLAVNNENFYFTIANLSLEALDSENIFYPFVFTISQMAENICSCPALEFVISPQYIKCYLDKPGLRVSDLSDYEEILDAKGLGELELHPQRPYLLFLNMDERFLSDTIE